MANNILVVTPPDDILLDGYRVLCVGLEHEQSQLVSDAVKETSHNDVIIYLTDILDPTWILDKKLKSNIIVFNAEMNDQTIVGYLAAQPDSYYFGTLKSIGSANNRAIYSKEQLLLTMEKNRTTNE
jgi:hypothetical protein